MATMSLGLSSNVELLHKTDLNSDEKFVLLVSDVPYNEATSNPPLQPSKSENFLIDKGAAGEDWLITTTGTWRVKKTKMRHFTKSTDEIWKHKEILKKSEITSLRSGYVMNTTYCQHANDKYKECKRVVTEVQLISDNGSPPVNTNYSLIQYKFPASNLLLSPPKKDGKYFRSTAPSCKRKMKEAVKSQAGPTTITAELSGNILTHQLPGSIPRNIDQVKYFRKKIRTENKPEESDEFKEILIYATKDSFGMKSIHNLNFHSKGIKFVFAVPPQIEEIISSCAKSTYPCDVLCIDTTFNVGHFFMTPLCYRLETVINKRTGKHVIMPGPCMFHIQEECKSVYLYFAHTLIEMNTDIDKVKFIGGDRGKGQNGFLYPFHSAILVPCARHIENNIKDQISDHQMQKTILADIFGSPTSKTKGLIDCERACYENRLSQLNKTWPNAFVEYFKKHVSDDIKNGMLSDVRKAIGLNDELFYNNGLECLNKKIKTKKREMQAMAACGAPVTRACSLFEAVKIYKQIILEERKFVHQAIYGAGPYTLADNYKHIQMDESEFCALNWEDKRKSLLQIDKFMKNGYEYEFSTMPA